MRSIVWIFSRIIFYFNSTFGIEKYGFKWLLKQERRLHNAILKFGFWYSFQFWLSESYFVVRPAGDLISALFLRREDIEP